MPGSGDKLQRRARAARQRDGLHQHDFDTATGAITLRALLPNGHYGSSFSPDSKVLYTAGSGSSPQGAIYQYDLSAANPASTVRIVSTDIAAIYGFVSLQLGPDGKLYASGWGALGGGYDHLSVINFPNALNTTASPNACGYQFNGPSLQGRRTYIGLPNMIDARPPAAIPADFSYSRGACGTIQFDAPSCAASYAWGFGDSTTSNAQSPVHTFNQPGTYTVTLTLNGSTVITHAVTIGPPASAATIYGSATACLSGGAPLGNYSVNGQAGLTYAWTITGGAIVGPATNDNVDVLWGALPGTVQVTITDATGCTRSQSITVTENCTGSLCTPRPPWLVNWWPFDESCGVMAEDIAGTVNNVGTYANGPVPTAGVVGGALSFDGLDDFVQVADAPELNFYYGCILDFAESITIDAWVRTNIPAGTSATSRVLTILDKRVNPSNASGYHLFLFNGRLGFQIDGANYIAPFTGPDSIDVADNQWHFVAVSLGMCRGGGGFLYVDGKKVRTLPPAGGFVNTANLYIGARDPAFGANFFPGAIDELEIFKAGKTEDELRAIFEARAAGKCKTGCSGLDIVVTPLEYQLEWKDGLAPTFTADGGTAPYTFAVTSGELPSGVLLDIGGSFFGVPQLEGAFYLAVTAADANGCRGTRNYAISVSTETCAPYCRGPAPREADVPFGGRSASEATQRPPLNRKDGAERAPRQRR